MANELDEALQLREDGDLEAAAKALGKIIDAEGDDEAEAWLWLAATWEDKKDPETAVTSYREALKLGLGDHETYGRLGLARALLDGDRPQEAISVLDDTEIGEDEDEMEELASALRHRASRVVWVLRLGRFHLTKIELALALLGLLSLGSTFLPWLSITYQGGAASRTAWQLTMQNAILVSVCAGTLIVCVIRMTNRRLHGLLTAIPAVAFAVCGVVGAVRAGFAVFAIAEVAQAYYFQYPNVDAARPHVGFYVACALVALHAAVAITALIRTPRRRSAPHVG